MLASSLCSILLATSLLVWLRFVSLLLNPALESPSGKPSRRKEGVHLWLQQSTVPEFQQFLCDITCFAICFPMPLMAIITNLTKT